MKPGGPLHSRWRGAVLTAGFMALLTGDGVASAPELRVCADPNNLPFSNEAGEGFENRIMQVLADDLGATMHYVWWAQRRGAIRNTLNADACDIVPGIVDGIETLATTRPYYHSSYVFVVPAESSLADVTSLDDPRLANATIGIQLIGDDGANSPPAHALTRRGLINNVRGFMVYGDYSSRAPQAPIIDAVASHAVDIAIVWGPVAGYFAREQRERLQLTPVAPQLDGDQWPMTFAIAIGVRKDDLDLRRQLDGALDRNHRSIAGILEQYHVPRVAAAAEPP
jgi:mxaJ protein